MRYRFGLAPMGQTPRIRLAPFCAALLRYANIAPVAVVAARTLSYREGMNARLWTNPVVDSDAPVHIYRFGDAAGVAPVYLVNLASQEALRGLQSLCSCSRCAARPTLRWGFEHG